MEINNHTNVTKQLTQTIIRFPDIRLQTRDAYKLRGYSGICSKNIRPCYTTTFTMHLTQTITIPGRLSFQPGHFFILNSESKALYLYLFYDKIKPYLSVNTDSFLVHL